MKEIKLIRDKRSEEILIYEKKKLICTDLTNK